MNRKSWSTSLPSPPINISCLKYRTTHTGELGPAQNERGSNLKIRSRSKSSCQTVCLLSGSPVRDCLAKNVDLGHLFNGSKPVSKSEDDLPDTIYFCIVVHFWAGLCVSYGYISDQHKIVAGLQAVETGVRPSPRERRARAR